MTVYRSLPLNMMACSVLSDVQRDFSPSHSLFSSQSLVTRFLDSWLLGFPRQAFRFCITSVFISLKPTLQRRCPGTWSRRRGGWPEGGSQLTVPSLSDWESVFISLNPTLQRRCPGTWSRCRGGRPEGGTQKNRADSD